MTGRINVIQTTTPPKAIYWFNAIPIKIPMAFFHRIRTNNFKIYVETHTHTKTQIAKTILRNRFRDIENKLKVTREPRVGRERQDRGRECIYLFTF